MSSQASPVVRELWDSLQDTHIKSERAHKAAKDIRNGLVKRHGDLKKGETSVSRWGHDPDSHLLRAANHEADKLNDEETDCLDELIAYPAKSAPDLAVKLAAVLHVWRSLHEKMALAFLNDAEKVLWPEVPVLKGGEG
jgi:hypothetical protein